MFGAGAGLDELRCVTEEFLQTVLPAQASNGAVGDHSREDPLASTGRKTRYPQK
jgi:hypothetical protein